MTIPRNREILPRFIYDNQGVTFGGKYKQWPGICFGIGTKSGEGLDKGIPATDK